jgi:uncharacterized protein (TIRG00374 family)
MHHVDGDRIEFTHSHAGRQKVSTIIAFAQGVAGGDRAQEPLAGVVEPKVGIEPTAYALPRRCSTSELLGPALRRRGGPRSDGDSTTPRPVIPLKDLWAMLPPMPLRSLVTSRRLAGVVGAAVLGVLVWRAGPGQVWAALRTLSLPALVAAIALNVPITLVRNLRTRRVLATLGHQVGWWSLTRTQLAGQTLSNLTPAAGGDLVRAWMWRRDDGVPGATGVAAVVYERVLSLVLLLGAGAAFFAPTIAGPAATTAICLGAAALIATPWLLARVATARHAAARLLALASRLPVLRTRTEPLRRMGQAVGALAQDTPLLGTFTATTLAVFVLSGLQIWLLTSGLTGTGAGAVTAPGLAAATGIYGSSQAGGSLSALPFGIGPADAIVVGLLLRTGIPFGLGTTVALLLRAAVTLPIGLAAAAAVSARRGETTDDTPLITWRTAAPAAAAAKDREVPAWP